MTEPSAGEEDRSVKALAALARAGYWSLCQPLTEVEFEVHHIVDRPGYLFSLVAGDRGAGKKGKKSRFFLETLSSSANGVGLVIGTRTDGPPARLRIRERGSSSEPRLYFKKEEDHYLFRGTARPNLTFLAESDRKFEGIIAIADRTNPAKLSHGLQVKELIAAISQLAADVVEAPLLSIQCPVQLPLEAAGEPENYRVPRSSSLAVRFSIALSRPNAQTNITLAERVVRYCDERGFRLWLADTRPGFRTGNWFVVRDHPPRNGRRSRHGRVRREGRIATILPVTFVGPARVGSTSAIVSMLEEFRDVGIVSASVTLLDDLAFIHLQLGLVPELKRSQLPLQFSRGEDPRSAITAALRGLAEGPHAVVREDRLRERAGDYQTLVGPPLAVGRPTQQRRLAIWISWQMERTDSGIATAVRTLRAAFERMGFRDGEHGLPNLEYLICRDLGNSILRGKGKFSLPVSVVSEIFEGRSLESEPSRLCVGLEDAWKAELDDDRKATNIHEVTVVWREYWLGHWSSTTA
ncbi:hypothetical protein ACIA5G_29590 [Amycolatopsis sp. NPDC051758]|uniref:hypothetical protein n=1 Tax=Amycolatopsis sp. NPDC051758 TaxID=3363935 RepID=UPI0037A8AA09